MMMFLVVGTAFAAGYVGISRLFDLLKRNRSKPAAYRDRIRDEDLQFARDSARRTDKGESYYRNVLGLQGSFSAEELEMRRAELIAQYQPDNLGRLTPRLRELAEIEIKEIEEAREFFEQRRG